MTKGRFITLEGGEGAGKSTQARLLAAALQARGLRVIVTREPGGTPNAERIRTMLLDPQGEGWGLRAEALLFAAARSDHVEKLIIPALASGAWVVCDRFVDSNCAYQGGGGGLADADIMALHAIGSGGLLPDLTLLFEVDAGEVARRLSSRDGGEADRIGGRPADYHARVAEAFRRLADADPDRFVRIDGNGMLEQTHARVMAALAPLLEQAG